VRARGDIDHKLSCSSNTASTSIVHPLGSEATPTTDLAPLPRSPKISINVSLNPFIISGCRPPPDAGSATTNPFAFTSRLTWFKLPSSFRNTLNIVSAHARAARTPFAASAAGPRCDSAVGARGPMPLTWSVFPTSTQKLYVPAGAGGGGSSSGG